MLESERQEKLALRTSLAMLPDIQAAIQQQRVDNILMTEYLARMNADTQTWAPASDPNLRVDIKGGLPVVSEGHLEKPASDEATKALCRWDHQVAISPLCYT